MTRIDEVKFFILHRISPRWKQWPPSSFFTGQLRLKSKQYISLCSIWHKVIRQWILLGRQNKSAILFANWFASPSPDFDSTLSWKNKMVKSQWTSLAGWKVSGHQPWSVFSQKRFLERGILKFWNLSSQANEGRSYRPMNLGFSGHFFFNVGGSTGMSCGNHTVNTWSTFGHPPISCITIGYQSCRSH